MIQCTDKKCAPEVSRASDAEHINFVEGEEYTFSEIEEALERLADQAEAEGYDDDAKYGGW